MGNYILSKDDKSVIEFTEKRLLPIANEVTNFYSHWTKSDEEEHLQKAFLYECRQQNIKLTREVAITQYYKDLAFTEKELDFFIFPKQSKSHFLRVSSSRPRRITRMIPVRPNLMEDINCSDISTHLHTIQTRI